MSEAEVYQSKLTEAEALASEARRALAVGDAETAKKAAADAVAAYRDAASSIPQQAKDAGEYGQELASVSGKIEDIASTWNSASERIVSNVSDQRTQVQEYIDTLEGNIKVLDNSITAMITSLQTIGSTKIELDTADAVANIDKLNSYLDELDGKTVTTYVQVIRKGSEAGIEEAEGHSTGAKIPGYGGGDTVNALLEPGEWVIRKEAVNKYGDAYLRMLNDMMLPKQGLPGFAIGGRFTTQDDRDERFRHKHGDRSEARKIPNIRELLSAFTKSGDQKDLYEPLNHLANLLDTDLVNVAMAHKMGVAGAGLGGPHALPANYREGYYKPEGDEKPNKRELDRLMATAASALVGGTLSGASTRAAFDALKDFMGLIGKSKKGTSLKEKYFGFGKRINKLTKIGFNSDEIDKLLSARLSRFNVGGKFMPQNLGFKSPASVSAGSVASSPSSNINHTVKFNVGGKVHGPFAAEPPVIETFLDALKQNKLRSE